MFVLIFIDFNSKLVMLPIDTTSQKFGRQNFPNDLLDIIWIFYGIHIHTYVVWLLVKIEPIKYF